MFARVREVTAIADARLTMVTSRTLCCEQVFSSRQGPGHPLALALNADGRTWTTCPALFIPSIEATAQADA